jgi:hypothetical protein
MNAMPDDKKIGRRKTGRLVKRFFSGVSAVFH